MRLICIPVLLVVLQIVLLKFVHQTVIGCCLNERICVIFDIADSLVPKWFQCSAGRCTVERETLAKCWLNCWYWSTYVQLHAEIAIDYNQIIVSARNLKLMYHFENTKIQLSHELRIASNICEIHSVYYRCWTESFLINQYYRKCCVHKQI